MRRLPSIKARVPGAPVLTVGPNTRNLENVEELLGSTPATEDNRYRDILEGLAFYLADPYVNDLLHTANHCDAPDLGVALNKKQIASKTWLLNEMFESVGSRFGRLCVLGGWYGVLPALILNDARFHIREAISVDVNPNCRAVAERLNQRHVATGMFRAVTADMCQLNYEKLLAHDHADSPNILINTSCEHLTDFETWYSRIPSGTLQVLQSNDYYDCTDHTNCVPSLQAFAEQVPMSRLVYQGTLAMRKYTRFMLIGYK